MAKTAKLKKRQITVHSRAARRAVSPSDPSLSKPTTSTRPTSASPPPHPAIPKPHVLAAKNAGISKRKSGKQMTRAQRLRQLKGMERAADNMDKLELKVKKSVGREKKVRERSQGWENVNGDGQAARKKKKREERDIEEADAEEGVERGGGREWLSDEEMDDDEVEANAKNQEDLPRAVVGEVKEVQEVAPQSVPLPMAVAEEDELL